MKLLNKVLVFLSISAVIGASVGTYAFTHKAESILDRTPTITSDDSTITMDNGTYTFTLNKSTLYFDITKGSQSWNSGKLSELEPETTAEGRTIPARERLLTNPVIVYYLVNNTNTTEASFSMYDPNQCETTIRVTNMGDYLSARLNILSGSRNKPNLNVYFNMNYYLMDDGLKISITDVEEKEAKCTLSRLAIYPGFGMSYQENNSKYLIPDGSGATIDLSVPSLAKSQLILTTYDSDSGLSTNNRSIYSPSKLSIPMFANYDANKTMMVTIESGDQYSELNVKRNEMIDKYNNIYYRFTFKEIMTYEIPGINTTIVQKKPQDRFNDCKPTIYYHLYDEGMEYFDIAKKYQEYLISKNILTNKYSSSAMRLEFLMAENKKAFIGTETYKMTSVNYVRSKVNSLVNDNYSDLSISLLGYSKGGYLNSLPNAFPIETKTGSDNDYASLGSFLKGKNIDLNYVVDLTRSFKERTNVALNIAQNEIVTNDYVNGSSMSTYRINPSVSVGLLNAYKGYLKTYRGTGFDFSSIGNELFSTYHRENNTRTQTMNRYVNALKNFNFVSNMKKPNFYMFKYFNNYLDAPIGNNGYLIESESIPFIQMVLSGYRSFYSSPINLNYVGEKQLVELIDYNVNPSYLLTEEDTTNLIDSPSSNYIPSSKYANWESKIKETYDKVNKVLKQVQGLAFIKREQIAPNVYKNTYENNKVIIVNYSSSDYDYSGHTVASLSGEVFEE